TVLRECVNRGRAMGEAAWMERVVKKPDLQTQVKPYLSRFLVQVKPYLSRFFRQVKPYLSRFFAWIMLFLRFNNE
ncbi:MAG: hypothetical protein WC058_14370, partial [Phycisphaeraceae bacterium]